MICDCGWANLDFRKKCRNCGKPLSPETTEPRSEAEAGGRGVSVEQLDRAEHQKAAVWEYNHYRAALTRDGEFFALLTLDGQNDLTPKAAEILLHALNQPPNVPETETVSVPIGPTPKGEASASERLFELQKSIAYAIIEARLATGELRNFSTSNKHVRNIEAELETVAKKLRKLISDGRAFGPIVRICDGPK